MLANINKRNDELEEKMKKEKEEDELLKDELNHLSLKEMHV